MSKRLVIPSLILPVFATLIPQLILSLLLIEIAFSFDIEVGVAGQLRTVASIVSAVMALLMGGLSVRYRHKSLMLIGLVCIGMASIGCFITPDFGILLVLFAVIGVSMAMVQPMSRALIGSLFSVEERPQVMGYLLGGQTLSYVIGPPIISVIDDWRLAFLVFTLPLALFSLFLAFVGVPSTPRSNPSSQRYLQGFKEVFGSKSAVACLIAQALSIMAFMVVNFYSIPFYRQQFLVDKTFTSLLLSGVAVIFVVGSVICGRLVNRFGRKRFTVISALISGVLVFVFINVPNLWLSIIVFSIAVFTFSVRNTSYNSLALEQVPEYGGTMMSLSQFSMGIGQALGIGLGGLILVAFYYGHMGVLGIAAIVAALLFHVFTIDPIQQAKQ